MPSIDVFAFEPKRHSKLCLNSLKCITPATVEETQCQGNETRSRSHEAENDLVFKVKVTVLRIKIKIKVAQQGGMKCTKEPRGWDSVLT